MPTLHLTRLQLPLQHLEAGRKRSNAAIGQGQPSHQNRALNRAAFEPKSVPLTKTMTLFAKGLNNEELNKVLTSSIVIDAKHTPNPFYYLALYQEQLMHQQLHTPPHGPLSIYHDMELMETFLEVGNIPDDET